jgi:hypothetical protein
MRYAVPQTDDPSEAAMAALVARLRETAPKPEALSSSPPVNLSDTTIARSLVKAIGEITSALGDRLGDGAVLTQWDGALDGVCIDLATIRIYNLRGRNRGAKAGADSSLDAIVERADAYLARLRPSGDKDGKTETPNFTASVADVGDRGRFRSSPRADSWVCAQRRVRGW